MKRVSHALSIISQALFLMNLNAFDYFDLFDHYSKCYFEQIRGRVRATAGLSTPLGAKCAANFAQGDSFLGVVDKKQRQKQKQKQKQVREQPRVLRLR
jgi:hypothetical protein